MQNYVVALQQARARYDAAVQNRILQQELFDGEQKRFQLGASTPYNVIQQQRDLIDRAIARDGGAGGYSTARIALDRTLGKTLEANHVSMAEARDGRVARQSSAPVAPPAQP